MEAASSSATLAVVASRPPGPGPCIRLSHTDVPMLACGFAWVRQFVRLVACSSGRGLVLWHTCPRIPRHAGRLANPGRTPTIWRRCRLSGRSADQVSVVIVTCTISLQCGSRALCFVQCLASFGGLQRCRPQFVCLMLRRRLWLRGRRCLALHLRRGVLCCTCSLAAAAEVISSGV